MTSGSSGDSRPIVIGLGGQRCGSSWLHEMLSHHPNIQTARGTKEVHFFNAHWARGADWYFDLWTPETAAVRWESTPNYLYHPDVIARIKALVPEPRFVVLLRDPVGRSRSHFRRFQVNSGQSLPFEDALKQRPSILSFSRYSVFLQRYFEEFGRDRVFIGFYEDITTRPNDLLRDITGFLGLAHVSQSPVEKTVNAVYVPRNRALYDTLYSLKKWLNRRGFGWITQSFRRLGGMRLLAQKQGEVSVHDLTDEDVKQLVAVRDTEIEALAGLGIDASLWRPSPTAAE